MYVMLRCSKCGDAAEVAFAQLYDIWKKGYEELCDEHKKRARVNTDVKCHCGTTDTHDGPMFKYLFQLIFDEVVRTSKA